jgi:ornithine cyclodeaminase/alanine dehydrogenase-like protein (mu-crystallin family)
VPLLVLSARDVHELLGYRDCVAVMRDALIALAGGAAEQPLRSVIAPAAAPGLMALMPSYLTGDQAAYGLKAITITPANPAAGLDTHQGVVLLSDGVTGEPRAVVNASAITELRTAAVSVLATQALAAPGAGRLAVIGTGVQARAHVLAFSQARPLTQIRVAGRDPERAAAFAADVRAAVGAAQPGVPVAAAESAEQAVAGADIVVTATSSTEPVLRLPWLAPGAHVNAVGACLPSARELDGATMAAAALFADSRAGIEAEAGDYRQARDEGLVGPWHVRAELGQVLAGTAPGRSRPDELTVFESLGLAVQDLAAAGHVYRRALANSAGQWAEF